MLDKITKKIYYFDMLDHPIKLNYKHKYKHPTLPGGIYTIFLFIVILFLTG